MFAAGWKCVLIGLLVWAGARPVGAQTTDSGDEAAEPAPRKPGEYKLTLGRYMLHGEGGADGTDVNLRWRRADTSVWVGAYQDRDFGRQLRAGVDTRWQPLRGVAASVLPSLQVASGGFVGGSLAVEVGSPWFVQLGIGRTNLRPYVNLNFDPNDAATLAFGWRNDQVGSVALTVVRDNRFGTGQQHVHLNGQWPLSNGQRLTVDLLRKSGMGDSGEVHATGLSVTWDWPRWFARMAVDPKQNFSRNDATRISAGWRF
jgi:hypothetical protein